jgi:hypothetical protein
MAQQKAHFKFEFITESAMGKLEFNPQTMSDPYPPESFDPRGQYRAVVLMLAPRLLKQGTSEGTGFESVVQLLEGEVETRVVRRYQVRRPHGV